MLTHELTQSEPFRLQIVYSNANELQMNQHVYVYNVRLIWYT